MKMRILTFILPFLFISSIAFAQTIPNLPTLHKYVNDYVGILSLSEVSAINDLAAQIENNSTVQIGVLIVDSTQPYAISDYSLQVFRANGIGQKENDNGVLIVVAVSDRQSFIATGYGVEGLIPDAKAGDIARACFVDNFRNGQYGDGIYCAVEDIGNIVQGQPEVIANTGTPIDDILFPLLFFGIFLLPFLGILILLVRGGLAPRCPKDGTRMEEIKQRDPYSEYTLYKCPKCGYKKRKKRSRFFWFFVPVGGGGWTSGGGGGGGGGFGGGSSGGGGGGSGW